MDPTMAARASERSELLNSQAGYLQANGCSTTVHARIRTDIPIQVFFLLVLAKDQQPIRTSVQVT